MHTSSVSLLTAVLTAIVVFLFTTAWFTAKAARNSLRMAKASIGPARKTFWSTIGAVLKMGVLGAVLLVALVAWQTRDGRTADSQPPTPSPSASRR